MDDSKELLAQLMQDLEEDARMSPEARFNEMVEAGLIDREGRVSTQLGGRSSSTRR